MSECPCNECTGRLELPPDNICPHGRDLAEDCSYCEREMIMAVCPLCDEPITHDDALSPTTIVVDGAHRFAHNECALRSVIGGIGHLMDHHQWCVEQHDPDAGMTYRESARLVVKWVHEHGTVG